MRFSDQENCCVWDALVADHPPEMQFCNFADMKMVEIFEGDIVTTPEGKFPIVWGVDGWITDCSVPKYLGEIDATVVGNIYDK